MSIFLRELFEKKIEVLLNNWCDEVIIFDKSYEKFVKHLISTRFILSVLKKYVLNRKFNCIIF